MLLVFEYPGGRTLFNILVQGNPRAKEAECLEAFKVCSSCREAPSLSLVLSDPLPMRDPLPSSYYGFTICPNPDCEALAQLRLQHVREDHLDMVRAGRDTTPENVDDVCGHCMRRKSPAGKPLLRCGRCKKARYCDAACQRLEWPVHKKICGKPPVRVDLKGMGIERVEDVFFNQDKSEGN
jgi:hypothetical protein